MRGSIVLSHVDLCCYCLGYISMFSANMQNHSLPDHSLYAVSEPLADPCDEDRVYVPLLQLVKQHVYNIVLLVFINQALNNTVEEHSMIY